MQTRSITLASRPKGVPGPENFRLATVMLRPLQDGEMLIANDILSMDAGVRGFLDEQPGYIDPIAIGQPVIGMSIGRVVESRHATFPCGTVIRTMADWSEMSVVSANAIGFERVVPDSRLRLETYMGALGAVGMTAWIGLHEIGKIKQGDTVLISAAAGATGSLAGQIAKIAGCRVVGMAGTPEKVGRITELGFDAAIDYRHAPDLAAAIKACCPDGVDVFFDNVGGKTLETVLPLMREGGRVVACGMMAQYNETDQPHGVRTLWQIVLKRLTIRGFLTFDHADRLAEAAADLERWVLDGRVRSDDTVYDGLEAAPRAFIDLMSGTTSGKTLVRIRR